MLFTTRRSSWYHAMMGNADHSEIHRKNVLSNKSNPPEARLGREVKERNGERE
jgi:hypothetical protein